METTLDFGINRALPVWPRACAAMIACVLGLPSAFATQPELIFRDGGERGVWLDGTAFAAAPLAAATVEASVAGATVSTVSDAQGRYQLFLEVPGATPSATIVLTARGVGPQAAQVWQSPLGPIDEAADRAGVDEVLVRSEDPFVDLTPRTTAIAAALREGGGGTISQNGPAFKTAARAVQHQFVIPLARMLHLYAEGAEPLPTAISDTLAAVASMGEIQRVYARHQEILQTAGTCVPPTSAFCLALQRYNFDTALVPISAPGLGVIFSSFGPWQRGAWPVDAVRIDGSTATLWAAFPEPTSLDGVPVLAGPDAWPVRVGFPDERALTTSVSFPTRPGLGQVRQLREVYAFHYRFTRGPGGDLLVASGQSFRNRYPDHPQLPTEDFPVSVLGFSAVVWSADTMVAPQPSMIPRLSGGQRWLLPVATAAAAPQPWLLQNEVGVLDAGGGIQLERSTVAATWAQAANGTLTLDLAQQPPVRLTVSFINEEEPGNWRVLVRARRTGQSDDEIVGSAILMQALPLESGFQTADLSGRRIRSEVNAQSCGGPLGTIEALLPVFPAPGASFCFPRFGWSFFATGVAASGQPPPTTPPTSLPTIWSILPAPNTGIVYFDRRNNANAPLTWRTWRLLRRVGDRAFVLEDFEFASPPAPFAMRRANRVTELSPYPD